MSYKGQRTIYLQRNLPSTAFAGASFPTVFTQREGIFSTYSENGQNGQNP